MINVLVPITDKAEKFNKLLANINGNQDIMVFVGIKKSQREQLDFLDSENITIVEFDDNSKREEILNALSLNLQEGEVMVLRKPIRNSLNSIRVRKTLQFANKKEVNSGDFSINCGRKY